MHCEFESVAEGFGGRWEERDVVTLVMDVLGVQILQSRLDSFAKGLLVGS